MGKEDTPPVDTDVELEQQRMMNRVFSCPNLYSAAGPFTTVVQMVPVMVANHQTGGYFVVHLPVQPLPEHVAQPHHVFHPQPSDSPFSSSSTSSSTCSSVSPPASDDGCRRVGLRERDRQLGGDGGRHQARRQPGLL